MLYALDTISEHTKIVLLHKGEENVTKQVNYWKAANTFCSWSGQTSWKWTEYSVHIDETREQYNEWGLTVNSECWWLV